MHTHIHTLFLFSSHIHVEGNGESLSSDTVNTLINLI